MKDRCIEAVVKAAGRRLTKAEVQGIEDRILGARETLKRQDRAAFSAMSEADRLTAAAKMASDQIIGEAVRKKAELIKNATVVAEARDYMAARVAAGDTNLTAVDRMLGAKRDMQGGITTVTENAAAIASDLSRNLGVLLNATGKWGGLFESREGIRAVMKELFNENSGNPMAKRAAKAWAEAAEAGRKQFNDEGGNIGHMENWGRPQTHDQMKAWKAGFPDWAAFVMGKLDREKYANDDGTLRTDDQMMDFLKKAHESIAQGGAASREPNQHGGGTSRRADRGSEARKILFKDADSAIEYEAKFGSGDPVDLLFGHFERMAKDIALVKQFGPNPDFMVKHLVGMADQADAQANLNPQKRMAERASVLNFYDYIAGHADPVHSELIQRAEQIATGVHVASKLGSAAITAINDQSTMIMTARTMGMPFMQMMRNQLAAFNPAARAEKDFARRAGLMHETFTHGVSRWGAETLTRNWSGKMANTVLKLSGLTAMTAAEKRAFGIGVYDMMGRLSRDHQSLASLHEADAATLARMGVDEQTFQVWRQADVVSRNKMTDTVLTPDTIYAVSDAKVREAIGADATDADVTRARRDAAQKLIGMSMMESDVAIPTPKARDRFDLYGKIQPGTWKGVIQKQIALFKATPYATLAEQWGRMMSQDGGFNRSVYAAKFLALTSFTGAFTLELNEMLQGKDPKDFTKHPVRFGAAAVLKGGGLGFFGDFLFSDDALQGKRGTLGGVSGPSGGTLESLIRLTVGNMGKSADDKKTSVASDASELAKSVIPGANLWYLKAAINHLWLHYIQDMLQPGYSSRMEQKTRQNTGQEYWWKPSQEGGPDRAPNLGAAFGQP